MIASRIKNLNVDALLSLRQQVEGQLNEIRAKLREELARIERLEQSEAQRAGIGRGRVSPIKGTKLAPKYRDPETGQTWAGRGLRPIWLSRALKRGRKLTDFAIDKPAKKPASKTLKSR